LRDLPTGDGSNTGVGRSTPVGDGSNGGAEASNGRNKNKFQPLIPTVDEAPKYMEDPLLQASKSTSAKKGRVDLLKKLNLGKVGTSSMNNITPEEHAEMMDQKALEETLRAEREDKAMVEEILRKQAEDEKSWEEYASQGHDPILPVISYFEEIPTQEIHVVKKQQRRGKQHAAVSQPPPVVPDIPQDVKKTKGKKEKKAVSEEAPPFRIFVKNKGRSEMIAKLQGKKFKFNEFGTDSTLEKAFDVE
ncbi:hypothetical protein Tco_0155630, partial [Tanacetum coccineum]